MTKGSVPRHLFLLATPMLLANLLNLGYSFVNVLWVGRFLGTDAIGAITISIPVVFIYIGAATGATAATSILVSQFFGARNYRMVAKTVNTSFSLILILSALSCAGGILFADRMLQTLGTPETIYPMALSYLRISFLNIPFVFLTLLIKSILRGIGDSKTPLYFIIAGIALNAALDPLMIIGIGPVPAMGLNGAAWASLISSFVTLALCAAYLRRRGSMLAISRHLSIDANIVRLICRIGFPSIIQQSAVSIGMVTITSFVNTFGAAAIAGFGAAGRIDSMVYMPAQSMGAAVSIIAAQNMGAGRFDRVDCVFRWALLMTVCVTCFLSLFFVLIPDKLLSPFTSDSDVIAVGANYLRIIGPATVFFAVMYVSNGIINGSGHTIVTLIFALTAVWGIRVPLAAVLSKGDLGLSGIWISYDVAFFLMMCASLIWYKSGLWKKPVI